MKITIIGAGSFNFTRSLVRDILTYPVLSDSTLALMDINEERLGYADEAVKKIISTGNYPAKVLATTNHSEALEGADAVITTIRVDPLDVWRKDLEIPMKYGVNINIGDTRGPAGIFRALRNIPVMLDIAKEMEQRCPDALLLNYTNPMAMICRAIQGQTRIIATGLCHSVQGTSEMLAQWIGAPMKEITYLCAGINHQAFYLEYKWNGKDAYPLIREAVARPEIYNKEIVRNEMFLHLGYYVTESSGHNSEYNSWFRKRQDLIEKYCTNGTNWNPGVNNFSVDLITKRENTWRDDFKKFANEQIDLKRGKEYAAGIINAFIGDGEFYSFNGNIRNYGLIDNLPEGCCVEVPVFASKGCLNAVHVGPLPDHLAILVNTSARCEELAVQGCLEGDARKIYYACANDPLTSAVLSLEEIKTMVQEMFNFNRDFLPTFRNITL